MKKGTRVYHCCRGYGTTMKKDKLLANYGCVSVLWDRRPSGRYNLGENPCAVFQGDLQTIKSKCCKADVKIEGKTTRYYVCQKCKKPCDIGEE